jgi:hypothetical protein
MFQSSTAPRTAPYPNTAPIPIQQGGTLSLTATYFSTLYPRSSAPIISA